MKSFIHIQSHSDSWTKSPGVFLFSNSVVSNTIKHQSPDFHGWVSQQIGLTWWQAPRWFFSCEPQVRRYEDLRTESLSNMIFTQPGHYKTLGFFGKGLDSIRLISWGIPGCWCLSSFIFCKTTDSLENLQADQRRSPSKLLISIFGLWSACSIWCVNVCKHGSIFKSWNFWNFYLLDRERLNMLNNNFNKTQK